MAMLAANTSMQAQQWVQPRRLIIDFGDRYHQLPRRLLQQQQQQQPQQQQVQLNKRALLTIEGVQLGSGVQLASASSLPISSPNAQVAHTRWTTFASVSIRSPLLSQN